MTLLPTDRATVTAGEAARILGVGRNQVYEACQRGELPSLRVGRRLLLPVAKLRLLLEPIDQPVVATSSFVAMAGDEVVGGFGPARHPSTSAADPGMAEK